PDRRKQLAKRTSRGSAAGLLALDWRPGGQASPGYPGVASAGSRSRVSRAPLRARVTSLTSERPQAGRRAPRTGARSTGLTREPFETFDSVGSPKAQTPPLSSLYGDGQWFKC